MITDLDCSVTPPFRPFATIEPGSIITVKRNAGAYGFVEVDYGAQVVLVFMRDIEKRADRVRGQAN